MWIAYVFRMRPDFRSEITVEWLKPHEDPALWAADVIAGALSSWFDDIGHYWDTLSPLVDLYTVEP